MIGCDGALARFTRVLKVKGDTLASIFKIAREYADNIDTTNEYAVQHKQRVLTLVSALLTAN